MCKCIHKRHKYRVIRLYLLLEVYSGQHFLREPSGGRAVGSAKRLGKSPQGSASLAHMTNIKLPAWLEIRPLSLVDHGLAGAVASFDSI